MSRPKRSRFMGHDYSIAFVPPGSVLEGEAWGVTDHSTQSIEVEDNLPHDKERCIVLHETLHQMIACSGLPIDGETEEAVVTFLGDALVGHMRDNPSFWRYLMQKPPPHQK